MYSLTEHSRQRERSPALRWIGCFPPGGSVWLRENVLLGRRDDRTIVVDEWGRIHFIICYRGWA